MGNIKNEHLLGSLDLLVLRVLASEDHLHGYGITEHIQTMSDDVLRVEEGSLYPALHRMDEAGWVSSEWGISENNRRARYYRITKAGRRRLADLEKNWAKHVDAVKRVLKLA
ncbi:MAG: PadR family transcriptional regulator [Acidobacteria bacterium]|nr:MAG: PadR family transcriptional regulator [Acidobacteriota bacterium]